MPTFEMILLLPKLENQFLKPLLRQSAEYIFQMRGTIRKMENLGVQPPPYRIGGKKNSEIHYFMVECDMNLDKMKELRETFRRDKRFLRMTSHLTKRSPDASVDEKKSECTLYLDLLPPPDRPSVIAMQSVISKEKRKLEKCKFQYNSGLDYYPF